MASGPNNSNKRPATKPAKTPSFTIQRNFDVPTVAAIAAVAYVLSSVIHEFIGHGLVCLLLGGKIATMSSVVTTSRGGMHPWAYRLMLSGGTLANLAAGMIAYRLLPRSRNRDGRLQYFLWLSMSVNLLIGAAYLTVPTTFGSGDWYQLLAGAPGAILWRVILIGLGVVIWIVTLRIMTPHFAPFLAAGDPNKQKFRARFLTITPYIVGGLIYCMAAGLNTAESGFVWLSAAGISFVGTFLLVVVPYRLKPEDFEEMPANPPVITRNAAWIAAAVVLTTLFIGLFGSGISL